jgi:hypothetical protein
MRQEHKLFKDHPLDGEFQLGDETVTTPYHIYNGSIFFIGGRANADVAKALLKNDQLTPILDRDGNALTALWVCDFTEANLGAHHELQFSIFASFKPLEPVEPHPFAIYRLLTHQPQTMMVCHGLWNSTEKVVRYNQEHLGLNARVSDSDIHIDKATKQANFRFNDDQSGHPLLQGEINLPQIQPPAVLIELFRHMGMGGMMKTLLNPTVEVAVVNTISPFATENKIARTYTRSDGQLIIKYSDEVATINIQHPDYQALQFKPDFVQNNNGVRFVYTHPVKP